MKPTRRFICPFHICSFSSNIACNIFTNRREQVQIYSLPFFGTIGERFEKKEKHTTNSNEESWLIFFYFREWMEKKKKRNSFDSSSNIKITRLCSLMRRGSAREAKSYVFLEKDEWFDANSETRSKINKRERKAWRKGEVKDRSRLISWKTCPKS